MCTKFYQNPLGSVEDMIENILVCIFGAQWESKELKENSNHIIMQFMINCYISIALLSTFYVIVH